MIKVTIETTSVHGLLTDLRALALSMERGIGAISSPTMEVKIPKMTSAELLQEQIDMNPKEEEDLPVLPPKKKTKVKAAPAPELAEAWKAKKADEEIEVEAFDPDSVTDPAQDAPDLDAISGLTLEDDILPAFMAFTKKNAAKMGKAEAVSHTNGIVKKLGYKSVRDIKEQDFGKAMKAIGA
jgi:hypothetical protein